MILYIHICTPVVVDFNGSKNRIRLPTDNERWCVNSSLLDLSRDPPCPSHVIREFFTGPPQLQDARPLDASRFPARFRSYSHLCRSSREVDSSNRWIIGGSGVRISHKYKRDKEVIPKICWTSHSFNMFQRDLETLDVLNVFWQPENYYLWFIFRYVYIYTIYTLGLHNLLFLGCQKRSRFWTITRCFP